MQKTYRFFFMIIMSIVCIKRLSRFWMSASLTGLHKQFTLLKEMTEYSAELQGTHGVRTHTISLLTLTITWFFNPTTTSLVGYPKVIPYTKFEHFGVFRFFWVMLRTNKQTDKHIDSNVLPMPTDRVSVGNNWSTWDCISLWLRNDKASYHKSHIYLFDTSSRHTTRRHGRDYLTKYDMHVYG